MSLTVSAFTGPFTPEIARQVIFRQAANLTPIYAAILALGSVRPTAAEEVKWYSDAHGARRTQINNGGSAYTSGTTSIVVDDGSVFFADCLVLCEATGEVMLCTAVSTNTLTVVRGLGSVVAAHANSVADDAYLRNLGPANGEGASAPTARMSGPSLVSNVVQTFRETIELTGRLQRVATDTEDERARQRMKKFKNQVISMEHAMVWGAKQLTATGANGKRVTSMAGLRQAVLTNVTSSIGAMSKDDFDSAVEAAMQQGGGRKVMFCGSTLLRSLHTIYHGKLNTVSSERVVGLQISQVNTPWGPVDLVPHNLFTGTYAGSGLLLDMAELELRPTNGGELQLKPDIQAPGDDSVKDEWFAEHTVTWGNETAHARLEGVTGAE